MSKVEEILQLAHGIENHVTFSEGEGCLTKVELKLTNGTMAEIFLHGAHVKSFVDERGHNLLFVSSQSLFDRKKAIRGAR